MPMKMIWDIKPPSVRNMGPIKENQAGGVSVSRLQLIQDPSEISVEEKERVETWMMFKRIKVNLSLTT